MKTVSCFSWLLLVSLTAEAGELPLQADDWAALRQVVEAAQLDATPEVNPKQGWPSLKGELSVRFSSKVGNRVLLVGHDAAGRVTKLIGNGPLLTNEAYASLARLPELRSARITGGYR